MRADGERAVGSAPSPSSTESGTHLRVVADGGSDGEVGERLERLTRSLRPRLEREAAGGATPATGIWAELAGAAALWAILDHERDRKPRGWR